MHVVLVSTGVVRIPPRTGGAVESYVWDLAQMLNASGVRVSLVSHHHPDSIDPRERGIEFVPTPSPIDRFPLRPEASALAHFVGGTAVSVATRLYLSRESEGIDRGQLVLHLNEEVSAFVLSRTVRRAVKILTIHNPPVALSPSEIGGVERFVRGIGSLTTLRFALPHVDRVVALSSPMGRFLEENWNVDSDRIAVLPLPVDTRLFQPAAETDRVPRGLLFVGRLEDRKNPAELIRCLANSPPDVTLTIVGRGPLESELRTQARSAGVSDRVRMVHGVSVEQLVRLYQTARALVLPSCLEVYPRVVIEAAACGLPVLLPSAPIYEDFVAAGFVSTHLAGDNRSLTESALRMVTDDRAWRAQSQAARRFAVEQLSYPMYVQKLLRVYRGAAV